MTSSFEVSRVTVAIVTYNASDDLRPCLESLERQVGPELEVLVVDNASADDSAKIARTFPAEHLEIRVLPQQENLGFAVGMNAAAAAARAPFVLSLNADTRPEADFVQTLLRRLTAHPELKVGAVTGRLTRIRRDGEPLRLDACGMRLTRSWRHLDRGSGEVDRGQYSDPERVFGGTGAATLFRKEALEDVAVVAGTSEISTPDDPAEVFDPFFHSFREDAELCFRLRERGWEILYEPAARAEHRRFNLPQRRSAMPPAVNLHSLKNRYLLRLYHQSLGNLFATLVPTLWRDLLALGHVVLRERSSLPAYTWLWRHRHAILDKSRRIRGRRSVPPSAINRWFSTTGMPL